jgi:hypothetical protein
MLKVLDCYVRDNQGLLTSDEILVEDFTPEGFFTADHGVEFRKAGETELLGYGSYDGPADVYESEEASWSIVLPVDRQLF